MPKEADISKIDTAAEHMVECLPTPDKEGGMDAFAAEVEHWMKQVGEIAKWRENRISRSGEAG